jgi:hypothetical protein
MISSLRMHTQFRYSPSFGYQARNTSPVQLWSGRCDGQSPGIQTPVIATSEPSSRRRRVHRALHVTEGSTGSGSLDDLDPAVAATAWYRRQGFHDSNSRKFIVPRLPGRGNRNYQSPTGKYPRYRPPTTPVTSTREDEEIDTSEVYCGVHNSQSIKTNYRLQPVIRSEPHHVFVQPVRELVVKRWRTFRRRFGGSLHSPLPDGMSEDLASTTSGSGLSGASSPAMSSDGKTRRLRAQEGCNIYSSLDSTMHYNSPANGYITTNESAINESLNLELVEPLAAAAALAVAEGRALSPSSQDLVSKPPHPSSSSETLFPSRNQSRAVSGLVPDATPESGVLIPSNANSNSSTPSFSARRAQKRQRRKSMLSEVCTPGDFHSGVAADAKCHLEPVDRSAPSGVRSALAAAREEAELPWNNRTQPQVHETISTPGPTSMRHTAGPSVQRRPRLMRMSTSGTQIFSPSEDGVELDGLPVGPDKEMWRGKGKRRERTYL